MPPDSDGAFGNGYFVELVNGSYRVYGPSGQVIEQLSQYQFWTNSGLTPDGSGIDPRIVYDPQSGRWFSAAITPTSFLLAVSKTSDPTQGWSGLSFRVADGTTKFPDFTALGVNESGVYLEASNDWYVVAIPKSDLLASQPTGANAVLFTSNQDPAGQGLPGFVAQPAVAPYLSGSEPFISAANWPAGELRISSIDWSGNVPTLNASGRSVFVQPMTSPVPAPQLGSNTPIDTLDPRLTDSAVYQDGKLFEVQTVEDNGHDALRWYEIGDPLGAPSLLASGDIAPPGLDVYDGSIAVNPLGQVVIGFSGSSASQYVGSYAVTGTVTASGISLSDPMLLAAGSSPYDGGRWGDYSTTTYDPANPTHFWTIQEIPIATNAWRTQITELVLPGAGGTQRTWFGGVGRFDNASQWTPKGVPQIGDTATINSGRVAARDESLQGISVQIGSSDASAPATLVLNDSTLGDLGVPERSHAALWAFGGSSLGGSLDVAKSGSLNLRAIGPDVLEDAGAITLNPDSQLIVSGLLDLSGVLRNAGRIEVARGTLRVDGPLSGRGELSVDTRATLELNTAQSGLLITSNPPGEATEMLRFDGVTGQYVGVFTPPGSGGLDNGQGLAYGPSGDVYTSSFGTSETGQILGYDGGTGAFRGVFVPHGSGGLGSASDLTFGPDGNLYVPNSFYGAPNVLEYDGLTGAFLRNFVAAGSGGLGQPGQVSFGANGTAFVTDSSNTYRYAAGTGVPDPAPGQAGAVFIPGATGAETIGPGGSLYVTASDSIKIYDSRTGAFLKTFATPSGTDLSDFQNITRIAFGPDHNLYALNYFGEVVRFNGATGAFLGSFVSGDGGALTRATGMAFMPSPQAVSFSGPDATLQLDQSAGGIVPLENFGAGDIVDLRYVAFGPDLKISATPSFLGRVTVSQNGSPVAAFTLSGRVHPDRLIATDDGHGGTAITAVGINIREDFHDLFGGGAGWDQADRGWAIQDPHPGFQGYSGATSSPPFGDASLPLPFHEAAAVSHPDFWTKG